MKVRPLLLAVGALAAVPALRRVLARRRTPGTPTPVVGPPVLPSAVPLGAAASGVDVAVAALQADPPR